MRAARRTFRVEYDGEQVTINAGELLDDRHQIVLAHPSEFTSEPNPASTYRGRSKPTMSAQDEGELIARQGRIRRARLDELAARERERPAPPDSEALFWRGVDRLLGLDRLEREEAEAKAFLDGFEASKAREVCAESEDLASWLDR